MRTMHDTSTVELGLAARGPDEASIARMRALLDHPSLVNRRDPLSTLRCWNLRCSPVPCVSRGPGCPRRSTARASICGFDQWRKVDGHLALVGSRHNDAVRNELSDLGVGGRYPSCVLGALRRRRFH
jgi:hypothetical protein